MTFSSWHHPNPWTHGAAHAHAAGAGGYGSSHGSGFGYSQGYGGWMSHSMMGRSAGGFGRMGWGGERFRGHGDGGRISEQHSAGDATGQCSEQHATSRAADQDSGRHHGGCHVGQGRSRAAADASPTPATAPAPAPAPAAPPINKEGAWDASKGGYVLGASGEVDAKLYTADDRSVTQYRVEGGTWQYLLRGQDDANKTMTIKGQPGSTVEFRFGNNQNGDWFNLGSTKNLDNKDHAKVQQTGLGVRVGVEEWANGDNDLNDYVFDLMDSKAKG
jgi:hypothetical protein